MPRWIDMGESTLLVENVGELLSNLPDNYTLEKQDPEPLPGGTILCNRVTAQRAKEQSPDPGKIELWADPDTGLVRRMDLSWPAQDGPGAGKRPPPRRGGGGARGRGGGGGRMGPPDGPPHHGPPRDGGRHDGPRRGDRGHGPGRRHHAGPPPHHGDGHPRPRFRHGPPRFGADHEPPPPRRMTFELIDVAPFDDAWFTPEAHSRDADDAPGSGRGP